MKKAFNYGERLRSLRQMRGFSQEWVALEAEITTSYYGMIERGTANPTVSMLENICSVLNISIVDIFMDDHAYEPPELDELSLQILHRVEGRSDREKELILSIIKSAFKLQSENKATPHKDCAAVAPADFSSD